MSIAIGHYEPGASWLARRDARWALLAIVPSLIAFAFLRQAGPLLAASLFSGILVAVARPTWAFLMPRLLAIVLAALPFVVLMPFVVDRGEQLWSVGPIHVTSAGLEQGLAFVMRALAIGLLALALLAAQPFHLILAALGKLGAPGVCCRLLALSYRYVFLLVEELQRLRVALRCRGFRNQSSAHAFRTVGQVAGSLIVRGADRGERVAIAMQARGMGGQWRCLKPYKTDAGDCLLVAATWTLVGGLLLWDRLG